MKKVFMTGAVLLIFVLMFAACSKKHEDSNKGGTVTLESIKTALEDAGYSPIMPNEEDMGMLPENVTNALVFLYEGAHGGTYIQVYEFKDNNSCAEYAKEFGSASITNGKFFTASDGHGHGEDEDFLNNLINGKSIK